MGSRSLSIGPALPDINLHDRPDNAAGNSHGDVRLQRAGFIRTMHEHTFLLQERFLFFLSPLGREIPSSISSDLQGLITQIKVQRVCVCVPRPTCGTCDTQIFTKKTVHRSISASGIRVYGFINNRLRARAVQRADAFEALVVVLGGGGGGGLLRVTPLLLGAPFVVALLTVLGGGQKERPALTVGHAPVLLATTGPEDADLPRAHNGLARSQLSGGGTSPLSAVPFRDPGRDFIKALKAPPNKGPPYV